MQDSLGYRVRRLYNDRPNPTFRVRPWTKCINWGNSRPPVGTDLAVPISNSFSAVAVASNKLSTFQVLEGKDGIRIPEFTNDRQVAQLWFNERNTIVCRDKLSGHSGDGIRFVQREDGIEFDAIPLAPLYVKYVKKQKEFRVHVAFGEVIDVQEKRKRRDLPEEFQTNYQVRNHQTGWVYCREDLQEPEGLRAMATATVEALRLDFGAVDLIWNEKRNEVYVLEVNTAPGLEGTTVEKYAEAFVKALT
jgi:glutathione synthase/RimK-type ligase-like ATP-grasp enzyme